MLMSHEYWIVCIVTVKVKIINLTLQLFEYLPTLKTTLLYGE